jgi:hypothetical protein
VSTLDAGWGWPSSAAKPHYFLAGESRSVCGKWWHIGPREPDTETHSSRDCVKCVRWLEAQRAKAAKP